jgi:adenosylcobinamide-GDP ribazoletransferase
VAAAVSAHTLGRGAAVAAMGVAPVAGADGLGADYARSVGPARATVGAVVAVAIVAAVTGWWVAPLAATAAVGAGGVVVVARRAFGGLTGDHLGAVEQVVEAAVLVVATLLAAHDTLWW